jgi:pyruvate/2-oxoglutarate dehydrogenase complex dihydrolipoamide acyltransferase (E2) component
MLEADGSGGGLVQHVHSKVVPVPWVRQLVIDAGRAARRRHAVHGLFEIDVTSARSALRDYREATGQELSFTAFVVGCVARAVAADPTVQAYRDLRGHEVIFDQVDVGLPVEVTVDGTPFAFTHVLRDAGRRGLLELHREIRDVKADPHRSPSVRKAPWVHAYLVLPGFVRVGLLSAVHRLPHRQRALAGTVGVTAVGMFGAGGGWGIAFQLHTLGVVIGGITRRPILFQGQLVEREWLQLTVSVDHDIVDGAPAARFVARLRTLLMSGDGIPRSAPLQTSTGRRL